MKARVLLPIRFPYELPSVFISRSDLPRRVPHVESSGKICIAPTTSLLIDVNRPEKIVSESLERARQIINSGLSSPNTQDFLDEFLAYWDPGTKSSLGSICSPIGKSRRLFTCAVHDWTGAGTDLTIVADSKSIADKWAGSAGKKTTALPSAFLLTLQSSFLPPDFEEEYTVSKFISLVSAHASQESVSTLFELFRRRRPPFSILLSVPISSHRGFALIGVRIERVRGEQASLAQKGWRKGKLTVSQTILFGANVALTRLSVMRLDPDFLISRCGGNSRVHQKSVVVIGCGAIGSQIARQLAMIGIGVIRLVDPEILKAENIHRHAIGMEGVGNRKVDALKRDIGKSYPHVEVMCKAEPVQAVMASEASFITAADMIVIAVGDETLELWLNAQLKAIKPRIHVWTEPLGLGQHSLLTGTGKVGCYSCLIRNSDEFGLVNIAAFAAPNQSFHRSLAGCSGSFLEFSAIDAIRASVEAVSLVNECLAGTILENLVVSRFGDPALFLSQGYKLSKRAGRFGAGQLTRDNSFANSECMICGGVAL